MKPEPLHSVHVGRNEKRRPGSKNGCSDEARDNKGENDTQYGEDEGENGTLVAVCLRQDIACSNVEQKAGKEAQVVRQSNGGNREEHGGDGTSHWCCCVSQQQ